MSLSKFEVKSKLVCKLPRLLNGS